MGTDKFQIKHLRSFMELTPQDQERCLESFRTEPLEEKNILNKYLKRTAEVNKHAHDDAVDNECFLCFDVHPMNFKFSTVLFCLCGVTHHSYYVLYVSVIEDTKLDSLSQFICDLLANIITTEVPQLKGFTLKFVLCRNNPLNNAVFNLFSQSNKTSGLYNTFPFILETNVLRQSHLHDPYVQLAWLEIMQGNLQQNTVREIFNRHREVAVAKKNTALKLFVDDFANLARDLLDSRFSVNLRLCTMERMDYFEQVIRSHMKSYKDRIISRIYLFDLVRALIHIYSL